MKESPVNILLVDDEPRNLDVLESFLQAPGISLVKALTPEQALLVLIDGNFAAIVLDIQLPEMSGLELASLIKQRKRTQHIPIIFLTAYFQEDKDVLTGYGTGAVDYLTKPINPKILKSKIDVFVDLFRKTRALAEANATLEAEIVRRLKVEEELHRMNTELEMRVAERTADLKLANSILHEREQLLQASEAEAKAASRAKDDFLAALSHELRTPLNPVLLLATDAASDASLPARVREDFEVIVKNVTLEARLIDDMLDLTRITHGKLALEMRPFDIHAGLNHAISLARSEIDQKQIELTLRLDATHRTVLGDDVRLKQVFWNVIKNAAKFTPVLGRITVETETLEASGEVGVRIVDTGIGMSSGELERIFEAFSQGDHAQNGGSHRFGGIGLGLAISKMMVKQHRGSITAFSEGPNRGTTFFIRLPLAAERVTNGGANHQTSEPKVDEPGPRKRCVLLVEDHEPTAHALSQLLAKRNFKVIEARCIAEARAAAESEPFDILLSDIGLPDGDGYQLMAELGRSRSIVGIALSGYGMERDLSRSQAAGFASHLVKPVGIEALDRALSTARPPG